MELEGFTKKDAFTYVKGRYTLKRHKYSSRWFCTYYEGDGRFCQTGEFPEPYNAYEACKKTVENLMKAVEKPPRDVFLQFTTTTYGDYDVIGTVIRDFRDRFPELPDASFTIETHEEKGRHYVTANAMIGSNESLFNLLDGRLSHVRWFLSCVEVNRNAHEDDA